jgi:hypothetical protein
MTALLSEGERAAQDRISEYCKEHPSRRRVYAAHLATLVSFRDQWRQVEGKTIKKRESEGKRQRKSASSSSSSSSSSDSDDTDDSASSSDDSHERRKKRRRRKKKEKKSKKTKRERRREKFGKEGRGFK